MGLQIISIVHIKFKATLKTAIAHTSVGTHPSLLYIRVSNSTEDIIVSTESTNLCQKRESKSFCAKNIQDKV